MKTVSHNACYVPSPNSVLLKSRFFRNECTEFLVELYFDRVTGVSYYTIICGAVPIHSLGFHSVRNACSDIRSFLRQAKCSSFDFYCKEIAR